MYCNKCGNELKNGSVFCNKCGNKVKDNSNAKIKIIKIIVAIIVAIIVSVIAITGIVVIIVNNEKTSNISPSTNLNEINNEALQNLQNEDNSKYNDEVLEETNENIIEEDINNNDNDNNNKSNTPNTPNTSTSNSSSIPVTSNNNYNSNSNNYATENKKETVRVPYFYRGSELQQCITQLDNLGISYKIVKEEKLSFSDNTIISVEHNGEKIEKGTTITITVADNLYEVTISASTSYLLRLVDIEYDDDDYVDVSLKVNGISVCNGLCKKSSPDAYIPDLMYLGTYKGKIPDKFEFDLTVEGKKVTKEIKYAYNNDGLLEIRDKPSL